MTCDAVREWLLDEAEPANGKSFPVEVIEHCRCCDTCEAIRTGLVDLEQRWRARPVPSAAESSKAAFLDRLAQPPTPASAPKARPSRRKVFWGSAVAAVLFVGAGLAILLFGPSRSAEARPDVLDQLIDWNLEISEAPSAVDRQRLFSERHEALKQSLGKAKLNSDDRALAEDLLANGAWMAQNEDPVEELNRFDSVASQLLDRVDASAADPVRSDRFAKQFRRINERAIERSMERVRLAKISDPQQKKLVHKLLKKDAERAEQIMNVIEKSPDLTKKELRQALEQTRKRHKPKKT
jgi:hypothetical protein